MKTITCIMPFLLFMVFFSACDNGLNKAYRKPMKAKEDIELKTVRLENQFEQVVNITDALSFLERNKKFKINYLDNIMPEEKQALEVFKLANDTSIKRLTQNANQIFSNFKPFEDDLTKAFLRVKGFYPEYDFPEVNTIVSGFGVSYAYIGNYLLIGLDFFDTITTFKPENMPQYILKYFRPELLVAKAIYNLSEGYAERDAIDKTFLAEMIYLGKRRYFVKEMIPNLNDSLVIEYTPQQLDYVKRYAQSLWDILLDRELLYKSDRMDKIHFLKPTPFINTISKDCPGRIGEFFGWKIVENYMLNNPNVTFQELMAEKDAAKIFVESGFVAKKIGEQR